MANYWGKRRISDEERAKLERLWVDYHTGAFESAGGFARIFVPRGSRGAMDNIILQPRPLPAWAINELRFTAWLMEHGREAWQTG